MPPVDPEDLAGGDHARVVRLGDESGRPIIYGQGESTHYQATVDGKTVRIPWGTTVQVSTSVDGPGNAEGNVPLLDLSIAQELAANEQLESVS